MKLCWIEYVSFGFFEMKRASIMHRLLILTTFLIYIQTKSIEFVTCRPSERLKLAKAMEKTI